MHEKWVWAFSGAIFALIHVPNIVFGQDVGPTLQQVVFAFAVGLTYYVTRRIAGTLIVTMVLHALWDFSTFIQAHSVDKLDNPTASLGSFAMYLAVIIGIFALVKILKTGDVVEPGGDQLAAFDAGPRRSIGLSLSPPRQIDEGARRGPGPRRMATPHHEEQVRRGP